MKKYWQFFHMGFQQLLEYRVNFVWSTILTVISTIILYLFWVAILGSNPQMRMSGFALGNYYLFITLIGAITFSNFRTVSDDIWEGDLAVDLLRPYNYFLKMFLLELPYKITRMLLGLVLIFFISRFTFLQIPLANLILASVAVLFAIGTRAFMAYSIAGLAFWFKRVHGFDALIFSFGRLFSGELIPLQFLPPALITFSLYLPFRYLAYFPVSIIMDEPNTTELVIGMLSVTLWLALMFIINRLIWKKGLSQFEATGR